MKGVTIIQADGTPESAPGSQLTAADLAPGSSGFADPSEAPVIGNQGTASTVSIQYDRPWRGGNDNNFNDQVTQTSGSPLAIEVFEGPLLTVTPTASATTVPAGSTVSFSATYEPSNVSGVTYNWSFDGGAANSTASAPTVTFNTGGTYKVTVQVSDDEGGGGVGAIPITVTSSTPSPSNNNGPPSGPHNGGGKGGQVPRKHQSGNGGHGHNGSNNNGSTGPHHSTTPTSASHGGTTPTGSGGSGTTTPGPGSPSSSPTPPATTHSVTPKSRVRHQTSHLKAAPPPAPGAQAPVVTGQLVSDVTPLPAGESPLVHVEAGVVATSQAARTRSGGSLARPDRRGARGYRAARPRGTPRTARKARLADTALRELTQPRIFMPVPYAFTTHDIDQAIYHVANALQIPVLILALLALAAVIYEFGAYLIELRGRRRRVFARISASAEQARRALFANDRSGAGAAARGVARSQVMADTLAFIVKQRPNPRRRSPDQ